MTIAPIRAAMAAIAFACLAPSALAQQGPPVAQPPSTAVLQDRVEELERLLRAETDRADRADHRARQAEREVQRLQGIVSELAAVRDARDEIANEQEQEPEDETPPPPQRESRRTPDTSRAQGTLGEIPASDLDNLQRSRGTDAAVLYNQAQDYLSGGQYQQAQRSFTTFIEEHGDDPNAAEARYWRAFALLAVRANNDAALGFSDYLQRYPSGPRAPDSYVRLGMALKAQDMTQPACAAFAEFRRRFPRAHAALRDLAARESRGLECGR